MGDGSKIQWTDASWNPATGCSHVSEGCDHCYAETLTRMKAAAGVWEAPDLPWTAENAAENVILHPERLDQPLRWRKPRMIFVNSMSDLFHPQIPTSFLLDVFRVMDKAGQHTFQVLTKRPKRQRDFVRLLRRCRDCGELKVIPSCGLCGCGTERPAPRPILPNVWLGTSIESRAYVGRADLLRETPAAIRFISAEPLLGPLVGDSDCDCGVPAWEGAGQHASGCRCLGADLDLTDIDWLIAGGESGSEFRAMDPGWVRRLEEACHGTMPIALAPDSDLIPDDDGSGTAFFVKQGSGPRAGKQGDLPDDLWEWKEFPSVN